MVLPITLSEIAPRISAGAFILNSGLSKRAVDAEAAAGMHGWAAGTYPFLKSLDPQQFVKGLSTAEIAIGAALLTPFVPTTVAGVALTAFSGGLLGLYLKTPGMRKEGSLAPTQEGLSLAKDSWLVGIGIGLVTRGLIERRPRVTVKKARKFADKQSKQAAREARRAARGLTGGARLLPLSRQERRADDAPPGAGRGPGGELRDDAHPHRGQRQVRRERGDAAALEMEIVLVVDDDRGVATLSATPQALTVTLTRSEKFWGLLRDLRVPRSAVREVEVVPDGLAATRGLRAPGLGLPWRMIGTWRRRGEKTLVTVRRGQPAVRIRLTGQRFDTLLIGSDDAAAVAAELTG